MNNEHSPDFDNAGPRDSREKGLLVSDESLVPEEVPSSDGTRVAPGGVPAVAESVGAARAPDHP